MTECATWFGPPGRALFGVVHVPADGEIRGGVALCPPLGYEYVCSHRTLRTVAEGLADVGFMALRFDYDGTGDSVGDAHDPDRVAAWTASVGHAVEFLRSAGAPALGVIGMRIGATLASAVVDECQASVLWDPVLSGKAFLREQRALHKVALSGAPEPSDETAVVELVGAEYTPETISALEQLELPARRIAPALALLRGDRPTQRLEKRLAGWSDVSMQEALGQDQMLDVESSTSLVPQETIDTIVSWLDAVMPEHLVPVDLSAACTVAHFPVGGQQLREQLVEVGPGKLFGVLTESCPTGADTGRPTLVCLNNATDHHLGPARLWVDWGRAMAAQRWRVIRFDLGGIGDSPPRRGEPIDRAYPVYAVTDVADVCERFAGDGAVFIGLCSGGLHGLYAGLTVPARGVIAINSAIQTPAALHSLMSPDNANPPGLLRNNHQRVRGRLYQLVPGPVWRVLNAAGRGPEKPRIFQALAARGVNVCLVYGAEEYNLWKARQSMRWVIDRLSRASKLAVVKVPGLDHAALQYQPRRQLAAILTRFVTEGFGSPIDAEAPRSIPPAH